MLGGVSPILTASKRAKRRMGLTAFHIALPLHGVRPHDSVKGDGGFSA